MRGPVFWRGFQRLVRWRIRLEMFAVRSQLATRSISRAGRRLMSGSPEEAKAETLQWKKYSASKYAIFFVAHLSGLVVFDLDLAC